MSRQVKQATPEELVARYEEAITSLQFRHVDELDVPDIHQARSVEAGIEECLLTFGSIDEGTRNSLKRRLAFVRLYWMALDRFEQDVWEAKKACGIDCHIEEGVISVVPSPRKDELDVIPF